MKHEYLSKDQANFQMSLIELLKRLWPFCKKHYWLLTISIISVIGLAVVSRLLPTLIGYAIDEGIKKSNTDLVLSIVLIYFIAEAVKAFFLFAHSYYFRKLGNRVLHYIREDLVKHMQYLPTQYFDKNPTGRLVTRLSNDVVSLGELFNEGILALFTQSITLLAILIAMALISVELTLYALCLGPLFVYLAFYLTEKIKILTRKAKKQIASINAFVAENLSGMKVIQLYNRVPKNSKRFARLSQQYCDVQIKTVKLYAMLWPTMNLFNATAISLTFYFGGLAKLEDALPIGALIAFIMHVQDIFPPFRQILEKYQIFQNSLTSGERIFSILSEPQESQENSQGNLAFRGQLEFRNVSFQYGPELPKALKNVSFSVQPGQSVALVGRTGSGKTTVISLLQRLYDYQSGEVLIDGNELNTINRQNVRRNIGVVQQDNFIFRGTVKENINLQDPSISDEKVTWAAELVGCDRIYRDDPKGLDKFVEERGNNLSVGERQLISFARILAFNPQILILDEATANIDSETELLIQKATQIVTKGRTSLIIAHRLSTIRHCDQILVLKDAEIIESGSHNSLMGNQGYYSELITHQGKEPAMK